MIPERWQQVKAVLEQVLDLAPEQRKAFLDGACRDDHALRQEVESLLLEADDGGDGLLQSPVHVSVKNGPLRGGPLVGCRIGPYQILEMIGEGGMGTLYRAARADDHYTKQVAIKLVRVGLITPLALERFRRKADPGESGASQHRPVAGGRCHRRRGPVCCDGVGRRTAHRRVLR